MFKQFCEAYTKRLISLLVVFIFAFIFAVGLLLVVDVDDLAHAYRLFGELVVHIGLRVVLAPSSEWTRRATWCRSKR